MAALGRGIVLIVEGGVALRALYSLTLRDEGFEVIEAVAVESAFQQACARRPHAVLAACTDEIDGADLAARLGQHGDTRNVPVILLAERDIEALRSRAGEAWVHAVLVRPCPRDLLLQQVRHAVARSKEVRQLLSRAAERPGTWAGATDPRGDPPPPALPPGRARAVQPHEATCPECGAGGLERLGVTRYSVMYRCGSCRRVGIERR